MKAKIIKICKDVEKEYNVNILFAVENGSRVWGMSSKDSDFDVRFVFVRPLKEYVTISPKSDVIKLSYNKKLEKVSPDGCFIDFVGMDIFKYSKLLASSNPTAIEWLISNIVYYGKQNEVLKEYANKFFNQASLFYHYKGMCKSNYQKYLARNNDVTYKRYLYCLRGLINAMYVKEFNKIPPINFVETCKEMEKKKTFVVFKNDVINDDLFKTIYKIIELKEKKKEIHIIDRITDIDVLIADFLKSSEQMQFQSTKKIRLNKLLDEEIRGILKIE